MTPRPKIKGIDLVFAQIPAPATWPLPQAAVLLGSQDSPGFISHLTGETLLEAHQGQSGALVSFYGSWRSSVRCRGSHRRPCSQQEICSPASSEFCTCRLLAFVKMAHPQEPDSSLQRRVVMIVFVSLLLDLLAFTMPLPLFPRLIASFVEGEKAQSGSTLLSSTLNSIRACRTALTSWRSGHLYDWSPNRPNNFKWDVTILGGLLGSVFSFCQFLVSPLIGRLSDTYGRRPILLLTMMGNITSAMLWLTSTTFGPYLLSRAIGGLSEGNVQLSIAMISDVSDPATRAKSLALVGIAFSICFTLGPSLGAWFAMRSSDIGVTRVAGVALNVYAAPAMISLILLILETIYLAITLPETKFLKQTATSPLNQSTSPEKHKNIRSSHLFDQRKWRLASLQKVHTTFLFFFSGAEFTLTFLTYDLYGFTNAQNGRLLGFIGVLSALLQGAYTRRSNKPPLSLVKSGICACVISLTLLSILPILRAKNGDLIEGTIDPLSSIFLYSAATTLAYVSATVVNSLNTLASLECDEDHHNRSIVSRGKALGDFRSAGQLGRAFGPIFATALYWARGPTFCYAICSIGSLAVLALTKTLNERRSDQTKFRKSQ
ncbi:hypothetical protein O181_047344 [Austropuccinia psidii MF-1]|uniref:Major facilitator superfamily (MFS) profile domain-containing protein n=1 Tax=Austropuccinia psidii MF-1 TaxID=1389203 RepID=A0A9Q3DQU4_9BASI|nr:hypothetical protein [Austropuccinia psidii MF-1]